MGRGRTSHVGISNVIAGDNLARALSPNRDAENRSSRASARDPNALMRDPSFNQQSPEAIEVERKFRIMQK